MIPAPIKVVWNALQDKMKLLKSQGGFQNLHLTMFKDPKSPAKNFPKLKGKAKEIKELARPLAWYWALHMQPEDLEPKRVDNM